MGSIERRIGAGRGGLIGTLVAVLVLVTGAVAVAGGHLTASTTDTQPLRSFEDLSDTGGRSFLTRTPGMVLLVAEAEDLTPGNATTMWWVVFNAPEECSDDECGEDDVFNEDGTLNFAGIAAAQVRIGNATGNVVKSDGTVEYGARLKSGEGNDHQIVIPPDSPGAPLLTVSGEDAEIHVVIQDHGKGRGGPPLLDQLSQLLANCTPQCGDPQFAVHLPLS